MTGVEEIEPLELVAPGTTPLVGMLLGSGLIPTEVPDGVGVEGGILMGIVGNRPGELVKPADLPVPVTVDPGVLDPPCAVDSEAFTVLLGRSPVRIPLSNNPEDVAEGEATEETPEAVGMTSVVVGLPVSDSDELAVLVDKSPDKSPPSSSPEVVAEGEATGDETPDDVGIASVEVRWPVDDSGMLVVLEPGSRSDSNPFTNPVDVTADGDTTEEEPPVAVGMTSLDVG
jgi:hypothetical protein